MNCIFIEQTHKICPDASISVQSQTKSVMHTPVAKVKSSQALHVYGCKNFNGLVTLLKQIICKDVRMASYLMHTCPRCKHFLGVVVRESNVGKTARPIRAFAFVVGTNFLGN